MAKRRAVRGSGGRGGTRSGTGGSRSGGSGQALGGLAILAAILAGGTYLYRHTGSASSSQPEALPSQPLSSPPVTPRRPSEPSPSTSAPPSPASPPIAHSPTATGPVPVAPFGTSEEVFEQGARLYAANCAGCHGRPGKDAKGPLAAQFWSRSDPRGAEAVAQPAGTLFEQTAKGNLVQGMPSYAQRLTDTQLWDLALLLKSAHEELPEPVLRLLRGGQ